ncbi:MAG: YtxH domain-containing protein [Flavisolibacter sp.]
MKKKEKIALALVAGLAVGAAVLYLFTSAKGRDIRKKAVQRGRQLLDEFPLVKDLNCKEEKKEAVS